MKKYLCLLFLIVIACETVKVLPVRYEVDPRLEPYVYSFYREAHDRGKNPHRNVRVSIGDTENPYILGSTYSRGLRREIIISEDHYDNITQEFAYSPDTLFHAMEKLVFHEMGHAVLNLDHCDPCYGIMHSMGSVLEYAGDEPLRKKMIDELFTQNRY